MAYSNVPYTAKLSRGETFAVFTVFQPIAKVFPLNHLPCTVHNGMNLMHREKFPVNSVFCAQPRKFSPSKVFFAVYGTCIPKTETRQESCGAKIVGYCIQSKGYRLLDEKTSRVFFRRDVIFNEQNFGHNSEVLKQDSPETFEADPKLKLNQLWNKSKILSLNN